MMPARWRKLWRDVAMERRRMALMIAAIAVSLIGIGAVLGAYTIMTREIASNYASTRPASAALELEGGVDPALLAAVRRQPGIAEADAGEILLARAKVGEDWRLLLLFVVEDFQAMRLNTFQHERGAWPPPDGTMLIERSAASVLAASEGDAVVVKTPHGQPRRVPITGVVHDPGLAPAWQEQEGYGYITRATLAQLGEAPVLGELRIAVRDRPLDPRAIEATVAELSRWLAEQGHPVRQVRVPPPGRHPHQSQMKGVLFLLLAFTAMTLVLSAVLVATSIAAMLARQVRELGVMKTIGARATQLAALYAVLIAGLGAIAMALALPVGVLGARSLSAMSAGMLNLNLTSQALPWWVFAVQAAAGILVPLAVAAVPILRASRLTVRAAMDQHGAGQPRRTSPRWQRLLQRVPRGALLALRNTFRRRARFVLTVALLAAGGAMYLTALNVSGGWDRIIGRIFENRRYDLEIRLSAPSTVADRLRQVPGVRTVEAWGYHRTTLRRPGQLEVVRTYPDGSHGSLAILGLPATTELLHLPLLAGRWLAPGDTDAVVINHLMLAQAPGTKVGDSLTLSFEGRPTTWKVVGIVEEVGSPGAAYVTDTAFARVAQTGGPSTQPVRLLRIATTARSAQARAEIIRALEQRLAQDHVSVEAMIPLALLHTAMGGHIQVLINLLLAMAGLMGVVGMLGLASTMGTNVLERTREIGVLKTIGATPAQIARLVIGEALVVAVLSWGAATALAVPLTHWVGTTVGMMSFRVRLPLVLSGTGIASWLALVLAVAVLATLVPARRASRLTVQQALGHL